VYVPLGMLNYMTLTRKWLSDVLTACETKRPMRSIHILTMLVGRGGSAKKACLLK
jgi:hypothetical protein